MPLEYFSLADGDVRVVKSVHDIHHHMTRQTASDIWFVELAGGPEATATEQLLQRYQKAFERTVETDRAGRPVVILFHLAEKSAQSVKNFSSP